MKRTYMVKRGTIKIRGQQFGAGETVEVDVEADKLDIEANIVRLHPVGDSSASPEPISVSIEEENDLSTDED